MEEGNIKVEVTDKLKNEIFRISLTFKLKEETTKTILNLVRLCIKEKC